MGTDLELIRIGRSRIPGGEPRTYFTREYHALHLYFGSGSLLLGRRNCSITPGSLSITPTGIRSTYTSDDAMDHIFIHFTVTDRNRRRSVPEFISGGPAVEPAAAAVNAALALYRDDPEWAEVKVNDALFSLASAGSAGLPSNADHPILDEILTYIDFHLPDIRCLDDLASRFRISGTHINRLFRRYLDTSAMRYIRDQRMESARYLLTETIIPIKDICFQVGIPDLHAFNKLCKAYFIQPPRVLRTRSIGATSSSRS